MIIPSRSEEY